MKLKYSVNQLLDDSLSLTEPVVYRNFFNPSFLNEEFIRSAIQSAIAYKAKENFRIWVGRSENNTYQDVIIKNPPLKDESIENWTRRIFQNNKFCMLFSQVEQFNDELVTSAAEFLNPLYETRGITMGGSSLTIFIGNYGYTPSGVHQDQEENSIFHFNLGPGYKQLFIWDPDEFEKLTGYKEAYFDIDKILPYGKSLGLYPNDFLFLPIKYYHIGKTDEFSIDFVIVISDCTNIKLTQDIFNNLIGEGFAKNQRINKLKHVNAKESITVITKEMVNEICINHECRNYSFENIIQSQIEDRYLSMLSNFNFSFPPRLHAQIKHELNDRYIKIRDPFKIYHKKLPNNKIALFIRGRELVANYYSFIDKLVENLNSSAMLSVNELTQRYACNDSEEQIILSFLLQTIYHKAVNLL